MPELLHPALLLEKEDHENTMSLCVQSSGPEIEQGPLKPGMWRALQSLALACAPQGPPWFQGHLQAREKTNLF